MMKKILIGILLLLGAPVLAQSFSPDALLSGKASSDAHVKVFFQDEIDPPKPAFVPSPVTWAPEEPTVSFTTPFGQTYKAYFVTHIPFVGFHMAVSPSGNVFVTEDIYYMSGTPAPTEAVQRSFAKQLTTLTQHQVSPKINILSVQRDGVALPLRLSDSAEAVTVELSEGPETPGLHHYVLSYVLHDSMLWGQQGNALFVSLFGARQPYAIERFAGVVSLPAESTTLDVRFAFGDNNLEADKAVAWRQDEQRLVFRSGRWLPADLDARLSLGVSKKGFVQTSLGERAADAFFASLWALVLLASLALMIGYYAVQIRLSGRTVQDKLYQAKIRQKWLYKPAVMRLVLAKSIDRRTLAGVIFALAQKGMIKVHQKGGIYALTRTEAHRRLPWTERLVLRRLFKGQKKVLLKDISLPSFIKHRLIPCVHLSYGCQYFLLTKQYMLMGGALVILGVVLAALSGGSLSAVLTVLFCLLLAWAVCLHVFFEKSAYRTFLRLLYEQYQAYMSGFSEETPADVLLKNVPFAVALDLTSLFPLKAGQLAWLTTTNKSESLSAVEKAIMQSLLYSKKTG